MKRSSPIFFVSKLKQSESQQTILGLLAKSTLSDLPLPLRCVQQRSPTLHQTSNCRTHQESSSCNMVNGIKRDRDAIDAIGDEQPPQGATHDEQIAKHIRLNETSISLTGDEDSKNRTAAYPRKFPLSSREDESAVGKVLAVTELLEAILQYLPFLHGNTDRHDDLLPKPPSSTASQATPSLTTFSLSNESTTNFEPPSGTPLHFAA